MIFSRLLILPSVDVHRHGARLPVALRAATRSSRGGRASSVLPTSDGSIRPLMLRRPTTLNPEP